MALMCAGGILLAAEIMTTPQRRRAKHEKNNIEIRISGREMKVYESDDHYLLPTAILFRPIIPISFSSAPGIYRYAVGMLPAEMTFVSLVLSFQCIQRSSSTAIML